MATVSGSSVGRSSTMPSIFEPAGNWEYDLFVIFSPDYIFFSRLFLVFAMFWFIWREGSGVTASRKHDEVSTNPELHQSLYQTKSYIFVLIHNVCYKNTCWDNRLSHLLLLTFYNFFFESPTNTRMIFVRPSWKFLTSSRSMSVGCRASTRAAFGSWHFFSDSATTAHSVTFDVNSSKITAK